MAKVSAAAAKFGFAVRIQDFFEDVLVELKKVTWPSKDELKASTTVVLVLLLLFAAVIGVMDLVLGAAVVELLTAV
jgi:preprotein translocase subunit SecE